MELSGDHAILASHSLFNCYLIMFLQNFKLHLSMGYISFSNIVILFYPH